MFDIGSRKWAGLTKIIEETGELNQVIGKLMGNRGETKHFDGSDLHEKLMEEMSDVWAALVFVSFHNNLDEEKMTQRIDEKISLFNEWHNQNLEK